MYNVMIVEDELLVRSGMRTLVDWHAHGFHLAAEAAHGREALDILESQSIDIVITDIRMPVMDGIQLIERIRERGLPCEIIVLSSYDDFAYVRKAMNLDVKDYIHKPTMNIRELIETLKRVAGVLNARQVMNDYRRMVLDTVEESREIVLGKIVKHAINKSAIDDKLIALLKDVYLAEEPFHAGMLRFCDCPKLSASAAAGNSFLPAQAVRSFLQKRGARCEKPPFAFHEEAFEVVLFAVEDRRLLEELAEEIVKSQPDILPIWEMTDEPIQLQQLPDMLGEVEKRVNRRFEQVTRQQSLHTFVQKSLRYIEDHYMDSLSLEKISSVVHASPVYLSRLFYKELGMTFVNYLTNYRVEQAKWLLLSTDLRTYEIADCVGYKNSKYFLRVFKKLVGQTPGEFREGKQA